VPGFVAWREKEQKKNRGMHEQLAAKADVWLFGNGPVRPVDSGRASAATIATFCRGTQLAALIRKWDTDPD
jgi:hypothetical protein